MQSIDIIRLSEKQKQQLITLKRKTGIENWNVLCRWALCMSLADPTEPPKEDIPSDSNVEMAWKVFAGDQSEIIKALLLEAFHQRKNNKNVNTNDLTAFLKQHINRGIHFLHKTTDFPSNC